MPVTYSSKYVPMVSIVQGGDLRPGDSFGIQAVSLSKIRVMSKDTSGGKAWFYTIGM